MPLAENTNLRGSIPYGGPPVYIVWIQLLCKCWMNNSFTCLVKSKPVKQEVSRSQWYFLLWWVLRHEPFLPFSHSPSDSLVQSFGPLQDVTIILKHWCDGVVKLSHSLHGLRGLNGRWSPFSCHPLGNSQLFKFAWNHCLQSSLVGRVH